MTLHTLQVPKTKTGVIIKAKQSLSFLEVLDHWIWESVGEQEKSQ